MREYTYREKFWMIKLLITLAVACHGARARQTDELLSAADDALASRGEVALQLTMDTFKQFVVEKPKQYNLILLYTANMHICRICKPFQDVFERVAMSYDAAGKARNRDDALPTVFAIADIGVHNEIGRLHNLNTLPHIVRINGEESDVTRSPSGSLGLAPRKFNIVKLDVSPQEVLEWVNREVGQDVDLHYTQIEKITRLAIIIAVLVALVFLAVKLVLLCRRKPSVISIVALIIYYISTSGIFYNLLHGMQWTGMRPDGVVEFLFSGARGQYLGEGLTMSGLTVTSGVCLFLASRLPYSEFARKADPNSLALRLVILLTMASLSLYAVIGAYIMKVGWYSDSSMTPPSHYRSGPLRVDQGNTY
jgi:hypothetical protein